MTRLYSATFGDERGIRFSRCLRYEMGGFDLTAFWRGERFEGIIPDDVRVLMTDGEPPDFTLLPMSWYVFSDQAAARIASRAGDAAQLLEAPLYHHQTGARIPGYKILNATRTSRCLDLSKSLIRYDDRYPDQIDAVFRYVFDESLIPRDLHVFRAAERPSQMFFSKELMEDLMTGEVLRNLAFLEYGGDETVEIRRGVGEAQ